MSKKVPINWDTADAYTKGVCSDASVWWSSKITKVKSDFDAEKLDNPSKTNSNANVVKELIDDNHIGWAVFFSGEALNEENLKRQADFVIEQIPKNIVEDDYVKSVMLEIITCKKEFDESLDSSLLSKLISYVKRLDNYHSKKKSNDVVLKILNNSVKLLEREL